jgi:hypothetical protein
LITGLADVRKVDQWSRQFAEACSGATKSNV